MRVPSVLIAADDDRVRIQRLRQLQRARTRRLESRRKSQMIKRIQPVGPAQRRKSRGRESAAENLSRRLANPLKAGLAGVVVERKHQQNSPAARRGICRLGIGLETRAKRWDHQQRKRNQPQNPAESLREVEGHDSLIIGCLPPQTLRRLPS